MQQPTFITEELCSLPLPRPPSAKIHRVWEACPKEYYAPADVRFSSPSNRHGRPSWDNSQSLPIPISPSASGLPLLTTRLFAAPGIALRRISGCWCIRRSRQATRGMPAPAKRRRRGDMLRLEGRRSGPFRQVERGCHYI